MIKTVNLLKRKRGMSMEEFIEHYESTHQRIGGNPPNNQQGLEVEFST